WTHMTGSPPYLVLHPTLLVFDLLISVINPPTPTPTLFPYTTLFRSASSSSSTSSSIPSPGSAGRRQRHGCPVSDRDTPNANSGADRKSTRLNSSHGSISYAVFCLKKKKNKQIALEIPKAMTSTKNDA